jgi:hypothetical protein
MQNNWKNYDANQSKVVDKMVSGFDAFRTYSFSSSLGTTIYGTFNFGEDKKIKSGTSWDHPCLMAHKVLKKYYDTYLWRQRNIHKSNIQDLKTEFSDTSRSNSNTLGFDLSNTLRQSDRQRQY